MKRTITRNLPACLLLLSGLWIGGQPAWAGDEAVEADPEFAGQILTLTEPKAVIQKSDNPRYRDLKDGTVMDLESRVVWVKQDSYQKLKQWLNWHDSGTYIEKLNKEKFGGSDQWRFPNKKELGSLFDENSSIPWNYYWTKNEVHLDPIFGNSHCCYWTGEEYKNEMAWGFNFIRGKAYLTMKGGIQKSLTVIRPVRNLTPEERQALGPEPQKESLAAQHDSEKGSP